MDTYPSPRGAASPSGKQRRNKHRQPNEKDYLSENEPPSTSMDSRGGSPYPTTPQKAAAGVVDGKSISTSSVNSKQRMRNRPRNATDQGAGASKPTRPGRDTPPPSTAPPKTVSAYAGATFHASPAPSILPIPSFYSKPPSDSPSHATPETTPSQAPSPPASDSETPAPQKSAPNSTTDASPLDIFFRADREERERSRRASSANSAASFASPYAPSNPVAPGNSLPTRRSGLQGPASRVLPGSRGIDGISGRPVGPAFSTPYQQRIDAARGVTTRTTQTPSSRVDEIEDKTMALKKYLFGGAFPESGLRGGSETIPSSSTSPPPSIGIDKDAMPSQPRTEQHAAYQSTTQDNLSRPPDLQAMEDNLRRLLKLDS